MDKEFYKSKTLWGFGLFVLAGVGQQLGLIPETVVAEIVKAALALLGIYGLRNSIE